MIHGQIVQLSYKLPYHWQTNHRHGKDDVNTISKIETLHHKMSQYLHFSEMYINYIQDFLRLTKENTKSTRYTSDVRIHIAANPA